MGRLPWCLARLAWLSEPSASLVEGSSLRISPRGGTPQGLTFPSLYALVSQWATVEEKTRCITVVVSGSSMGACLVILLAPLVMEYQGWDVLFLGTGYLGLAWALAWWLTVPKVGGWRQAGLRVLLGLRVKGWVDSGDDGGERVALVRSHGRWKRPCLRTTAECDLVVLLGRAC